MDKCVSWYNIVSGYAILGVCPSGWGCNYRLKVSNTMSNTDNTNTRHCPDCEIALSDTYRIRCDRCYNRSDNNELTHEIALAEDILRRGPDNVDEVWHAFAYTYLRRQQSALVITDAGDHRIENLWYTLWRALDGDIEQDETWGMFMDALPGLPDFRTKTFEVEIPLDTITVEVEAKDEDEAIELGMQKAEDEYSLGDVIQQRYVEAHEV